VDVGVGPVAAVERLERVVVREQGAEEEDLAADEEEGARLGDVGAGAGENQPASAATTAATPRPSRMRLSGLAACGA
jgi:hypothetical protein